MGAHKQEGCVQRTMRSAMMVALSFFVANAVAFQVPAGFTAVQQSKPSHSVRRYSSGYTSGSAYTSTTPTSSTTPTTPTTPVAGSVKIKQTVTITGVTAAQFTGAVQTMYNKGYGESIGIMKTDKKTYADGCKVESTASRRAVKVAYVATVTPTLKVAAKANADAIAADPSKLVTALAAVKAADPAFAAIAVPTAADLKVSAATQEEIVSGAATNALTSVFSFAAVLMAVTFAKW